MDGINNAHIIELANEQGTDNTIFRRSSSYGDASQIQAARRGGSGTIEYAGMITVAGSLTLRDPEEGSKPKLVLNPLGGPGNTFHAVEYVLATGLTNEFAIVEGFKGYLPEGSLTYADCRLTATVAFDLQPGDADLNLTPGAPAAGGQVPEPGVLALLACSLLVGLLARRGRKTGIDAE